MAIADPIVSGHVGVDAARQGCEVLSLRQHSRPTDMILAVNNFSRPMICHSVRRLGLRLHTRLPSTLQ
jgi:hypothetical protein